MTEAEVVQQVTADPLVVQAHTRVIAGVPSPPTQAFLEGVAQSELRNEVNSFLHRKEVRRNFLEADYTLTLSTGTAVSGAGTKFTMPDYVGQITSIKVGTAFRPLRKIPTRAEFDRWYFENVGDNVSGLAEVWVEWGRSNEGDLEILLGPGTSEDATGTVHYVRSIPQPAPLSIVPEELHYVIVTGTKNRASGGRHQFSYDSDITDALSTLEGMIGGHSVMPASKLVRNKNWRMSNDIAGGDASSDHSPYFVSR